MSGESQSDGIASRKRPSANTGEVDAHSPPKRGRSPVIETEELYAAEYSLPADVLIVEGKRIKVHKLLLPQKFSNINAFFNSDAGEFEINDFPYEIVKVAVAFAHGYPLPLLEVHELVQLSMFAELYGYDDLKSTAFSTFTDMCNDVKYNIHELAALLVNLVAAITPDFRNSAAASSTTKNTSNVPNATVKPEPVDHVDAEIVSNTNNARVKQEAPENPMVVASYRPNN